MRSKYLECEKMGLVAVPLLAIFLLCGIGLELQLVFPKMDKIVIQDNLNKRIN